VRVDGGHRPVMNGLLPIRRYETEAQKPRSSASSPRGGVGGRLTSRAVGIRRRNEDARCATGTYVLNGTKA
jgi:hypothetical protein